MGERPVARTDVASEAGYHSPQLDVDVRLNTNESPFPPPQGFVEAVAEAARGIDWNRYPDRSATRLRSALADRYGVDVEQVFAANGSNEVLQRLLVADGGARCAGEVEPQPIALDREISRWVASPLETKGARILRYPEHPVAAPEVRVESST